MMNKTEDIDRKLGKSQQSDLNSSFHSTNSQHLLKVYDADEITKDHSSFKTDQDKLAHEVAVSRQQAEDNKKTIIRRCLFILFGILLMFTLRLYGIIVSLFPF